MLSDRVSVAGESVPVCELCGAYGAVVVRWMATCSNSGVMVSRVVCPSCVDRGLVDELVERCGHGRLSHWHSVYDMSAQLARSPVAVGETVGWLHRG